MILAIFSFDCGMMVIRYMDVWDGVARYQFKSMPQYTTVCKYVLLWHCSGWFLNAVNKFVGCLLFSRTIAGIQRTICGQMDITWG